jgi:hypothetical protein
VEHGREAERVDSIYDSSYDSIYDEVAGRFGYRSIFRVLCLAWVVPALWLGTVGLRAAADTGDSADVAAAIDPVQAVSVSLALVMLLVGLICSIRPGWVAGLARGPVLALTSCVMVRLSLGWLPIIDAAPALIVVEAVALAWSAMAAFRSQGSSRLPGLGFGFGWSGLSIRRPRAASLSALDQLGH